MPTDTPSQAAATPTPVATASLPDLLIVGDSHSSALADGVAAHGLRYEHLRLSGNHWHAGEVVFSAEHGFWTPRQRWARNEIIAMRGRLGGRKLADPDLPILATFGWHLGRMVPPFMLAGHVADAGDFTANPGAHFVSSAMVARYVEAIRGLHVVTARRVARLAPLLMVAPPLPNEDATWRALHAAIVTQMRGAGLTVVDPVTEFLPGGVLPERWLTPDRVHGNADYGRALVAELLERGLIRRRGA